MGKTVSKLETHQVDAHNDFRKETPEMPIFLIHGFKWPRTPIRHHVILQDVNDAAPDYLMNATTPAALRGSLTKLYPNLMRHIPDIQFIEQYDPEDDGPNAGCQPYAFVADKVIKSDLNINIREAQEKNPISATAWDALVDLKEALVGQEEELGWYVVYNGDVARAGFQTLTDEQWDEEAKACIDLQTILYLESNTKQTDVTKNKRGFLKRLLSKDSTKSKESTHTKDSSNTRNNSKS